MPRPLFIAALASVAALIVTSHAVAPAAVRAAEPALSEFVELAEAFGQICEEDAQTTSCSTTQEDILIPPFNVVYTTIGDLPEFFSVIANNYRATVTEVAPADADVLAYFDQLVTQALGDDPQAHAWLTDMNAGPSPLGSLVRGDWQLNWYSDYSNYDGEAEGTSTINFGLVYTYPVASPAGSPSLLPATCLDADVIEAIEGLDSGEVGAEPSPEDVADALDALDLVGTQDEARDRLVGALREPLGDGFDLALAAAIFQSEVRMATCDLFSPSPVPSSTPEAVGPSAPAEPDPAPGGDGTFAASIPAPTEVTTDPIVLLQSAGLAALLVFLMPFPSQLFNSTLEAHEDEVRQWLRLDRIGSAVGKLGAFWGSWPGVAVFTVLAALLYGFLDPGFGLSLGSLATFVGMLVGIVLVTAAFAVPIVIAHRRLGDRWQLKVVPVSLLIGIACVLLSRLTGFQPGYLYGLLIGLAFARELSAADEGRATAIGAVVMLVVAFAAWLGLGVLPEGDGFGIVAMRTSLAALMVAGLEGVVFGLLPMRFLPGEPLYAWNRILWGALLAVGAFAFFHILINPAAGYLSDSSRTPLFTVLALLIGFSLVSVAFWAWFRFRSEPPVA